MANYAPQVHEITTNETKTVSVDFTNELDNASPLELLSGTPTVSQVSAGSPEELTISSVTKNSAAVTINGTSVIANRAVQFTLSANTAGIYKISVICSTTASHTLEGFVKVIVC